MTIKLIISTCHTATANTPLLLLPPPCCRHISKRAPATTKIALPPSCRLHPQAGCHCHAATTATSAAMLPTPCYHCLQNIKNVILLTNLFFTTMVTAAHSNNGRNQLTCIEKDKQKNNNKLRQHEKNKPIFQFLLSFFLAQPHVAQTITIAIVIAVHRNNCQRRMQPALSPPPSPLPRQLSLSL